MKKSEEKALNAVYEHWRVTDPTPAEQVGWSCDNDQLVRFEQFLKLGKIKTLIGSSILEVGCGDGALVGFLEQTLKTKDFAYSGVDINKAYIKRAQEFHPSRTFIYDNFLRDHFSENFDFVVASGIFNVNIFDTRERAYAVLFETIEKMLSLATHGAAFNFLSQRSGEGFVLADDMMIYDSKKISTWLDHKKLQYSVIEGYEDVDTTVIIHC